jgi:hypothetical protein
VSGQQQHGCDNAMAATCEAGTAIQVADEILLSLSLTKKNRFFTSALMQSAI